MGTSVKTGMAPDFKSATDLKDVIPAIGASVGISDIGQAVAFYKKHRTAIQAVLAFLGGIFGRGKDKDGTPVPPDTSAGPAPGGNTGTPPSPNVPGAGIPPTPAPTERMPIGLRSRWFLIERKNRPGEYGGGRHILGKDDFDEITKGDGWARLGDRLHVDTTPYDEYGDFQPGGEENRSLLVDPNDPEGENGRSRITHHIDGNGELTSEYDDYGCTPVILVPWEDGDGPIKNDTDVESAVTYHAEMVRADGKKLVGNTLRRVRIKA